MNLPGRPLVIHPGAIGDLIRLTAMLRALAKRWDSPCDVITRSGKAPQVFAGLSSVSEVHRLPSRTQPFFASPVQWRLVRWLRQRLPSPVYVIEKNPRPIAPWSSVGRVEWLLAKAGIAADCLVTTRDCSRELLEHVVAYELRLAGVDPPAFAAAARGDRTVPDAQPEVALAPAEIEECHDWLAAQDWHDTPLVLLQTEARRTNRGRWPRAKWCRLIGMILESEPDARILLLGAPHEQGQTRKLAATVDDRRVHDVAGKLPLRRLFALLTLANSCVSLDTGPAHAAAALRCPVVVLAGKADPRRHRPIGSPAQVQVVTAWPEQDWPASPHVWFATHRLAEIAVDAVFQAWRSLSHRAAPD